MNVASCLQMFALTEKEADDPLETPISFEHFNKVLLSGVYL
jgi:hypothetical protein